MKVKNEKLRKEIKIRNNLGRTISDLYYYSSMISNLSNVLADYTIISNDDIEDMKGDLMLANDLLNATIRQLSNARISQNNKINFIKENMRRVNENGRK